MEVRDIISVAISVPLVACACLIVQTFTLLHHVLLAVLIILYYSTVTECYDHDVLIHYRKIMYR